MTRIHGVVLAGAVALSSSVFAQGEGPRVDGNWQVTMETQMPGMPTGMPPTTMTQCISKAEAADPTKMVPQGQGRGAMSNCKATDYKASGNTVTWSVQCDGPNPVAAEGEFVYSGDTYASTMKMNMGRSGVMTMKTNGKRLGDCTK